MSRDLDSFQTGLLADLRGRIETGSVDDRQGATGFRGRAGRTRPGRVAVAASVATLAAAAVGAVALNAATATPAFAVTQGADGTIEVEINRLEDAPLLQQALRDEGVQAIIEYRYDGKTCADGRYAFAPTAVPDSRTSFTFGEGISITLDRRDITPRSTVVITAARLPDRLDGDIVSTNGAAANFGIAHGPVGPCVPVSPEVPQP